MTTPRADVDPGFYTRIKRKLVEHGFHPISIQHTSTKARKRKYSKARYERLKGDPVWQAHRLERQREHRNSDEYRKKHAEEMRRWRAGKSPEWKAAELERRRSYKPREQEVKLYHGVPVCNVRVVRKSNSQQCTTSL